MKRLSRSSLCPVSHHLLLYALHSTSGFFVLKVPLSSTLVAGHLLMQRHDSSVRRVWRFAIQVQFDPAVAGSTECKKFHNMLMWVLLIERVPVHY